MSNSSITYSIVATAAAAGGCILLGVGYLRKRPNPFAVDTRRPAKVPSDAEGWSLLQKDRDKVIRNVYARKKVPEKLDAIVIGSGIGGLACAAILSKTGKRVLVLEQHDRAGGACHSFADEAYEFDPGIHYIGEMNYNSDSKFLLDQLSDGQIQWKKLHANFDTVIFGKDELPIFEGKEEVVASFCKKYPHEEAGIRRYFRWLNANVKKLTMYFGLMKILPKWLVRLILIIPFNPLNSFVKLATQSTYDFLSTFVKDPTVISSLTYLWGDMGVPPKDSSAFLHAILQAHYMQGASYPIGGSSQFPYYIVPTISRAGGAVLVRAKVQNILVSGTRITGVKMEHDGTEIYAPLVISDAGLVNTRKLLPPPSQNLLYTPKQVKNSQSCFCLFVGLSGDNEELGLNSRQYWVYKSPNYEQDLAKCMADGPQNIIEKGGSFPFMFVTFPSAKDPSVAIQHPGAVTCNVIAMAPYDWFAQWQKEPATRRSQEYQAFKNALGESLWRQTCERFPQLKNRVQYFEVGTPLTMEHFLAAEEGALYGLDHTKERFTAENVINIRPQTNIKGLYLTGQDVLCCGFVGALFAGFLTSAAILRRNLDWDLSSLKRKCKKEGK